MRNIPPATSQLRRASEAAHRLMGAGLGLVTTLAALDERMADRIALAHWGWPVGIFLLGLVIGVLFVSRVKSWKEPTRPAAPDWRRQVLIALLLLVAGVFEVMAAGGWVTAAEWRYAWPLVLFAIALLLITYPEHGTREAQLASGTFHQLAGLTVGIGAMLAGLEAVRPALPFATLWAVALLVAGVELVLYREAPGRWAAEEPSR